MTVTSNPATSRRAASPVGSLPRSDARTVARAAPPAPTSGGNPSLALAAVCIGFFMVLLDGSAVNVALPAIRDELHGDIASMQWVVNAYTVPLAAVLLSGGSIADRWGARRVFAWTLVLFSLASLACSLSPSVGVLVAARAVQGAVAAGLLPATLTVIAYSYQDTVARAKAITVWGATGASALLVGPLLGGVLTDAFGWRSIFLINVPVGAVTTWLALRYARETPANANRGFDLYGQTAAIVSLAALVAGLIEGGSAGWTAVSTLGLLALTVVCGAAFFCIERRVADPIMPLGLFRRSAFTAAISNGFTFQMGGYGVQFMLAVYIQTQWHDSAMTTGVLFAPFAIAWVLGTALVARKLVRKGPRWLLWVGASFSFVGSLLLLPMDGSASWPLFLVGTTLIGLGCGVFSPSLNASVFLAVEPKQNGLASGVLNSARQIGMAIGVALLGAFLGLSDSALGLRINVGIVALCFLSIIVVSRRWIARAA